MRVLVVAAHPDDEILGCGGTLLKHKEMGDTIFACIVTKAHTSLWTDEYKQKKLVEAQEVDNLIGFEERYYCHLPTLHLSSQPTLKVNGTINEVVQAVKPDIIYTHHEHDVNKDHGLVYEAVMAATRPIEDRIKVCCFETLSSTEWSNKPFQPNYYVNIDSYIDKKIEAFCKYESEVKQYPHPRSPEGIRILSQKRGIDVCVKHAEAFIVVRDYWL